MQQAGNPIREEVTLTVAHNTIFQSSTTYELIEPLEKSFPPNKQQAFHRYLHPYFTKMAHNVIQNYIQHYTSPGDIVCDPFCGTGVTGIEAIALGRSAVCVDISPLAEFMSRVLISPNFPIDEFDDEVSALLGTVEILAKQIEKVGTSSPIDVRSKVPKKLWSKIELVNLTMKLPKNSDVETVEELFDARQHIVGSLIKSEIDKIPNPIVRDALNLCLCGALARANFTYLYSDSRPGSILHNGGPSIFGEYRYHVPEKRIFVPLFDLFIRRVKYIRQIKEASNIIYETNSSNGIFSRVVRGNALRLVDVIGPNSVDYIFTDPPYGAHIAYLDLAAMWAAWMGWKISDADKKNEVIEGGEIGNTQARYLELLNRSIEESYKVLKPGRWLSIVFQHKDSSIWSSLVSSFKDIGFQYRNTVVQRTFLSSIHKKKNPLKVLSEQLILNFTKSTKTVVSFKSVDIPIKDLVLEATKKAILLYDGATLDDIYNTLTPVLIESGHLHKAKDVLDNLEHILIEHFSFNKDNQKYRFKSGSYLKTNFGTSDRLVLYLRSVFNKTGNASLDQIITSVLPTIAEDRDMKTSNLFKELEKIAVTRDGKRYVLKDAFEDDNPQILKELKAIPLFEPELRTLGLKQGTHDAIIYLLANLGRSLGYQIWIGKPEQANEVFGIKLKQLSLKSIPMKVSPTQMRALRQIDCIWFRDDIPVRAFEVEMSTDIEGALKRFLSILGTESGLAGRLHLIINKSMKRKFRGVLESSVYIGQPYLMQTKISYVLTDSFIDHWNTLCSMSSIAEKDFVAIFSPGTLLP
jgi:DNA modification methylase